MVLSEGFQQKWETETVMCDRGHEVGLLLYAHGVCISQKNTVMVSEPLLGWFYGVENTSVICDISPYICADRMLIQ